MSLKTLYKVWLLALPPAILTCVLYIVLATLRYLRAAPPGDNGFTALPYIFYAHGLGIFLVGLFMALMLTVWPGFKQPETRRLAAVLFAVHALVALVAYKAQVLAFLFFFNPLAFAGVAALPFISWQIIQKRINKRAMTLIGIIALLIVIEQVAGWYFLFKR